MSYLKLWELYLLSVPSSTEGHRSPLEATERNGGQFPRTDFGPAASTKAARTPKAMLVWGNIKEYMDICDMNVMSDINMECNDMDARTDVSVECNEMKVVNQY